MTQLEQFLIHLSAERGLSPNTLQAYRHDIESFLEFCQVKKRDPLQPTVQDFRHFVGHLGNRELSKRTIGRKIAALRQFYQFLLQEGEVDVNPSELIHFRFQQTILPKHLSVDEMTRLVEAADPATDRGLRDRALLELWYATGCRVTELASLAADAINWEESLVRVVGKGRRERWIPVSDGALEWCTKYRKVRHDWLQRSGKGDAPEFFLSQRGTRLTRQTIWKMVKQYGKTAGIERNIWPHMIRHSFATHVLQGGADLRSVQELLGHRSITTTEVYTHLDPENLKLMQLKYHPRG